MKELSFIILNFIAVNLCSSEELECGKTPVRPYDSPAGVVAAAVNFSWPWQVLLEARLDGNKPPVYSSASIIDSEWILTSAKIFQGHEEDAGRFKAMFGLENIFAKDINENIGIERQDIYEIHVHPLYNPENNSYDIALAKLSPEAIKFSDKVQPVCISRSFDYSNVNHSYGYVASWIDEDESGLLRQKQERVPIINKWECEKLILRKLAEKLICAGYQPSKVFQSGVPFVIRNESEKKWYQIGIGSKTDECRPDIFTVPLCEFIDDTIGKQICSQ